MDKIKFENVVLKSCLGPFKSLQNMELNQIDKRILMIVTESDLATKAKYLLKYMFNTVIFRQNTT